MEKQIVNKQTERGQVLILLLLIVLVVLTIVLAIAERSVGSLSNSDKTDQASRAYSAAEAGVEHAIQSGITTGIITTPLPDQSTYTVGPAILYPIANQMLEYPRIDKNTFAQFWLVNPSTLAVPPGVGSLFSLYFGNANLGDPPFNRNVNGVVALEVNLIDKNSSGNYVSHKFLFDPNNSRALGNGFDSADVTCPPPGGAVASELGSTRNFACVAKVDISSYVSAGEVPTLMRVRILYANEKQALGLMPTAGASLPPQASIFTSTGTSGNSVVAIQVFQISNVVSPFMDYALFSVKDISK